MAAGHALQAAAGDVSARGDAAASCGGTEDPGTRFTDELWEASAPIREQIAVLPFVVGLGDGTLERDEFERYLDQDMQYLDAYSRALALLAAAAPEELSLIHISEPTRPVCSSRMPSSA